MTMVKVEDIDVLLTPVPMKIRLVTRSLIWIIKIAI